jgi:hypothetical protein
MSTTFLVYVEAPAEEAEETLRYGSLFGGDPHHIAKAERIGWVCPSLSKTSRTKWSFTEDEAYATRWKAAGLEVKEVYA